ncbi:hypothetical protein ACTFOV_22350 [Bacillus cereus group sp. MYBK79-2]
MLKTKIKRWEILLYVVQLMESYAVKYRVRFHLQVDGNRNESRDFLPTV